MIHWLFLFYNYYYQQVRRLSVETTAMFNLNNLRPTATYVSVRNKLKYYSSKHHDT